MQGRNGYDNLSGFLFGLGIATWLICTVLRIFVWRFHAVAVIYTVVSILNTLVYVWAFFRILSRNISARSLENERYLSLRAKVLPFIDRIKNRRTYTDIPYTQQPPKDDEHIFRNCPNCKTRLRLKKIKGKHNTVCPKCGTHFSVRVL